MTIALLTPLLAAALLVLGELVFPSRRDPAWLVGVAAAALAISAVVLLAATAHVGRSLALTVTGTVAAVAAVAVFRLLLSHGRR